MREGLPIACAGGSSGTGADGGMQRVHGLRGFVPGGTWAAIFAAAKAGGDGIALARAGGDAADDGGDSGVLIFWRGAGGAGYGALADEFAGGNLRAAGAACE